MVPYPVRSFICAFSSVYVQYRIVHVAECGACQYPASVFNAQVTLRFRVCVCVFVTGVNSIGHVYWAKYAKFILLSAGLGSF